MWCMSTAAKLQNNLNLGRWLVNRKVELYKGIEWIQLNLTRLIFTLQIFSPFPIPFAMVTRSVFNRGEKLPQINLPSAVTLSLLLVAVYLFSWSFKKLRRSGKAQQPTGPRGLPLVGYLPFLGRNTNKTFLELTKIYGPIYKLSLGQRQYVLISSPHLAKEVVRQQDIIFANRNPTIAALAFSLGGKDIAFTPYGKEWRMLGRIFVREMLSKANLDPFYALRQNEVTRSVRYVYWKKNGTPVDVVLLAFSTVINMITGMFLGGTIQGDKEAAATTNAEFRAAVSELLVIWGKSNILDFIPSLARFDLQVKDWRGI